MPSAIRQLLSQTSYNTDGSTTVWDFSFAGGYLNSTHVKAYTRNPTTGVITNLSLAPLGADLVGPFQLRITPALVVGSELTIYRDTPKDLPLVNFADKASFSEASLDINAKQSIFAAAESSDGLATALSSVAATAALVTVAQSYATTATAAATLATTQAGLAGGSATAAAASAVAANASALAAAASAASIAGGPVASFNTRTGAVTLTKVDVTGTGLAKSDIGLSNVDNTSDANKPVSTAQAAADAATLASAIAADPASSNANPLANTGASQGVSARYSRQDHQHPAPASGAITLAMLETLAKPIGAGVTYVDVTGSRALSTNYTNTSGRTKYVSAFINIGGTAIPIGSVDGVGVVRGGFASNTVYSDCGISFPVPHGSVYRIDCTAGSRTAWYEM